MFKLFLASVYMVIYRAEGARGGTSMLFAFVCQDVNHWMPTDFGPNRNLHRES
jgi:hypothetical protein